MEILNIYMNSSDLVHVYCVLVTRLGQFVYLYKAKLLLKLKKHKTFIKIAHDYFKIQMWTLGSSCPVYFALTLGALMTKIPSELKLELSCSRSIPSGTLCFCRKSSIPSLVACARMVNSRSSFNFTVMSSGEYCCMFSTSLYSFPSRSLSSTVQSDCGSFCVWKSAVGATE